MDVPEEVTPAAKAMGEIGQRLASIGATKLPPDDDVAAMSPMMGPEIPDVEPFRGNGKVVYLKPKSNPHAEQIRAIIAASAMPPGAEYTTVLSVRHDLVVVEARSAPCRGNGWHDSVTDLVKEPPVVELYPEALVWSRINWKPTVGILVAQNARDAARTAELTAVQASAYARQMRLEDPGCTHCCILGGLEASRIRIVELWMNEKFFQDHEKSQWRDEAEQRVVPLVADMTCDSVRGMQYECPPAEPKNKT